MTKKRNLLERMPRTFSAVRGRDYFAETVGMVAREDAVARGSWMSSMWAPFRTKKVEAQEVAWALMRVQGCVRNFLRIHGVPKNTQISLATVGCGAKGAAGFGSVDRGSTTTFSKPYILLDKSIYEEAKEGEMLDLYLGAALHEAGHLNNTRSLFTMLARGELPENLRMWVNLFEDERVEDLEKKRSPGYAPYLHALKRALFEKKEFGFALQNWTELPDMDKVAILAFAFIRAPHTLTHVHKEWKSVGGTCVFEELRKCVGARVVTEADVLRAAKAVDSLLARIRREYPEAPGAPGGGAGESADKSDGSAGKSAGKGKGGEEGAAGGEEGAEAGGEVADRREAQAKADARDAADKKRLRSADGDVRRAGESLTGTGNAKEMSTTMERGRDDKALEKAADALEDARAERDSVFDDRKGRFSPMDMERMLERLGGLSKPLDLEESKEYAKATEDKITFGDEWCEGTWKGHMAITRRTVIIHPKGTPASKRRYKQAYKSVQKMIARTRSLFHFRLGKRTYVQRERTEGRLDRSRLASAMSTDRIFRTSYTREDKGIAVCLLLDESGSMGAADSTSSLAHTALQLGILFAASLEKVPGVELEVYSHESCGESDKDCLIRCLYGKDNPNIESIGAYNHGAQNYDSQAIREVGAKFAKNVTNENRLLIVLSDGSPCGHRYGGLPARQATRRAVQEIKKKYGIESVQVAIGGYGGCEEMFDNVLVWSDFNTLLANMRGMLARLVKRYTNK